MSEVMAPQSLRAGVAEEIRVLLVRRRLSATELARLIGVTQSYLARRMSGAQPFTLDDLEGVARALGVQVTDLFPATAGSRSTGGYHATASPRPPDRRPTARPARGGPPSGPGRASRIRPGIAA